ncbi:hypothetical protein PHYC_02253 [Phycisphaerales bacterium]|nr:hypothetical protein PHYC_02253 [Phycisphaerales bacterium]
MTRITGVYREVGASGERAKAFIALALPVSDPPLRLAGELARLHRDAGEAVARLALAGVMVPDAGWFLYGFVRKEAVISSQIEGTQATLMDVLTFEATRETDQPEDVEEVCNYVSAMEHARRELARSGGLPISTRLLCEAHRRLMRGVRGADKAPGQLRRVQNWIGGSSLMRASFVPPPADEVPGAMGALEKWIHGDDALSPLVKAGLAHVQFETIHPFLDGNGRLGRLLITLLLEHWKVLSSPLLYLSLAFRRRQSEYYARLAAVRAEGDWEGWTGFYLECVMEAANDGVRVARELFAVLERDRRRVAQHKRATVAALRLMDALPRRPVVTAPMVSKALGVTAPTARKAMDVLADAGVLKETTGKDRDRAFAYGEYLEVLMGKAGGSLREVQ